MTEGFAAIKRRDGPGNWNGLLARVLARQHVRAVYQPIVRLADHTVLGYEALARPATVSDDGSVEEFFSAAKRQGVIRDLDWLCRRAAAHGARGLDPQIFLSLNLSNDALINPWMDVEVLLELLDWMGRPPSGVVLEVTKPLDVADLGTLMAALQPYRQHGIKLALASITEVDAVTALDEERIPDFIKLSRLLVPRLSDEPVRSFLSSVVAFSGHHGCTVVAEGIETDEIAARFIDLGVGVGQGYLLGRPGRMEGSEDEAD